MLQRTVGRIKHWTPALNDECRRLWDQYKNDALVAEAMGATAYAIKRHRQRLKLYLTGPRGPSKQSRWTPDMDATLKRMRDDGYSSSHIAAALGGGITTNAVVGRAHRLGLESRARIFPKDKTKRRRPTTRGNTQRSKLSKIFLVDIDDTPDAETPVEQRRSLIELTKDTCRWPIGDPAKDDFFFCGSEPAGGFPYCAKHCCRAFARAT